MVQVAVIISARHVNCVMELGLLQCRVEGLVELKAQLRGQIPKGLLHLAQVGRIPPMNLVGANPFADLMGRAFSRPSRRKLLRLREAAAIFNQTR